MTVYVIFGLYGRSLESYRKSLLGLSRQTCKDFKVVVSTDDSLRAFSIESMFPDLDITIVGDKSANGDYLGTIFNACFQSIVPVEDALVLCSGADVYFSNKMIACIIEEGASTPYVHAHCRMRRDAKRAFSDSELNTFASLIEETSKYGPCGQLILCNSLVYQAIGGWDEEISMAEWFNLKNSKAVENLPDVNFYKRAVKYMKSSNLLAHNITDIIIPEPEFLLHFPHPHESHVRKGEQLEK